MDCPGLALPFRLELPAGADVGRFNMVREGPGAIKACGGGTRGPGPAPKLVEDWTIEYFVGGARVLLPKRRNMLSGRGAALCDLAELSYASVHNLAFLTAASSTTFLLASALGSS